MVVAAGNLTGNGTGNDDHGAHESPHVILFIFASCALGALARTILKKIRLPYTVVLLLIGVIIGLIATYAPDFKEYTTLSQMDPHLILNVFLPVLIFESAFAMDAHTFLKSFIQVVILAIPGLLLASFLTAVLAMFVFNYNWLWPDALMFGSIMSATDPVAVVALLKELGASKQLATAIEGESLLNDGAAIVIFNVFLGMAQQGSSAEADAGQIIAYFARVTFAGPAFGFFMAKLTILWLSNIFNDSLTEITITLASTYVTFYVGEVFLGVSGVLAVVVLGIALNAERTSISPEVEVFLHRFWEMLAYLANTLIFILVGVVITERAITGVDPIDWFYMLALYCGVNIIRGFTIAVFSPLIKRIGYGLTWRNGAVMTWGGLRGAVGLALALLVAQDSKIGATKGNKVLLHTAGIVLLTLTINAPTVQGLLKVLGMSDISAPKRMAMASAVRHLQTSQIRSLNMLKTDRFLADADWDMVDKWSSIEDPYDTKDEEAEMDNLAYYKRLSPCPDCHAMVPNEPSPQEYKEMENEARLRLLKAEKVSYWKQFEHGMLSREAVRKLVEQTEHAADVEGEFIKVHDIKKSWEIRGIYPFLKRKFENWIFDTRVSALKPPKRRILYNAFRITNHEAFEFTIYTIIFLNMIPIIVESTIDENVYKANKISFAITNYVFFVLYIIEAILKIMAQSKNYFLSHWNQFDLLIIVLSIVDIVIDQVLDETDTQGFNANLLKIPKIFRILRMSRLLRLFRPLVPKIIIFLNNQINKQLSYGYDVGKGYVVGEEETRKLIEHIVDDKTIAKKLKNISDAGRLEVIKELGLLQREHPGIAVSVKTRQAIRSILNNLRDSISELRGDGLLDETEGEKLQIMVEERMKRLLKAPSSIPPPAPINMLKNIPWIKGDDRVLNFFEERAEVQNHDFGSILMKKGDRTNGIYVILSGMVRLEGINDTSVKSESSKGGTAEMEEIVDYLTAGNVIGEMGFLTNSSRNATIVCETNVSVYFIAMEHMLLAIHTFTEHPSLELRLWHICGTRLATTILLNQPNYAGWSRDRVKMYLERSYIVNTAGKSVLEIVEFDCVVLIQGVVINAATREEYVGPCYIPHTTTKIVMKVTEKTDHIILVVPNEAQLMDRASVTSIHQRPSNYKTNLCLRHASSHRLDLNQRISNIKLAESRTSIHNLVRRMSSTTAKSKKLPPISNRKVEDVETKIDI